METFYQSFLTPTISICGYELNDFSYNHLVILRAINSPFVDEDSNATSADLIIALKICSSKYPEKDFSFTRRDRWKAFLLGKNTKRLYLECLNFSSYIASHQYCPELMELTDSSTWRKATSPGELSTVTLLTKNNIPHNQAWNMSIGYANWLSAVILEQAGNPRMFADPEDKPININDRSEEDIIQIAKEQLSTERFKKWLEARKKNQKAGA